jgi:DNA invertase Pin-like site-specific DNA recombinase
VLIGYARTSALEAQADLAAQRRALTGFGCSKVFIDAELLRDRQPVRDEAVRFIREGDALVVQRADRLARTPAELMRLVDGLTKRHIGLVVLTGFPMKLDTRDAACASVLATIRAVAGWERSRRRELQRPGIAKAQAAGKYRGRQRVIDPRLIVELARQGLRPAAIGRAVGCSRSAVYDALPGGYKVARHAKPEPKARIDARTVQVLSSLMRTGEVAKQMGISTASVRRLRVPKPDTSPPGRWG